MYPAARARARPVPLAHGPLSAFLCLSASLPRAICTSSLPGLFPCARIPLPIPCRLVYTYVKESNDSKKKKNRRLLFHRGTTRITYHIAVYFPLFSPPKRWWKETRLEAVFQHAVDGRRNVLEQRFVTGFLVAAVESPSSRSPVSSQLSRIIFPARLSPSGVGRPSSIRRG